MEAVVLSKFGAASHLEMQSVPDPHPGAGEVLLRVRACGVCYHDILNRRGSLPRTSVRISGGIGGTAASPRVSAMK